MVGGWHAFSPQLVLVNWTCSVPRWGWSDRGSKWYKLSIGWYRLGYRWVLPIFLHKQRKKVKPYLKLMASVHLNMDFGVSVCNGPLWVMQVSWAAPKFKATSYYSNYPLILSAAHIKWRGMMSLSSSSWGLIGVGGSTSKGAAAWATFGNLCRQD